MASLGARIRVAHEAARDGDGPPSAGQPHRNDDERHKPNAELPGGPGMLGAVDEVPRPAWGVRGFAHAAARRDARMRGRRTRVIIPRLGIATKHRNFSGTASFRGP